MRKRNKIYLETIVFTLKRVLLLTLFLVLVTVISPHDKYLLLDDQKIFDGSSQDSVMGSQANDSEVFTVARVIDGDTIVLTNSQTIRYIGIDSPEAKGEDNCFYNQAKIKNEEMVLGKKVHLVKDVSEKDRYGRLLRYVYVESTPENVANKQRIFVNEELVRGGYAKVSTYPPDVKYQQVFLQAEREAFELQKGLWSECF